MKYYVEPKFEKYNDKLARLYPERFFSSDTILTLTFQVTEDCCMACTYCYQNNKSKNKMDFSVAQKVIDNLLNDDKYYHTEKINGLILEFIGGEPFMEVQLIDEITSYFIKKCIDLNHRFLFNFRISMASNGLLYFEEEVQNYIKKYKDFLSLAISIDGNKELHDTCRIDLNGNGTYNRVVAAARHLRENYIQDLETKMTLSPDNIKYIFSAIQNLIAIGYTSISLNCVYEEGWELSHAKILYDELRKTADWLIETDSFRKYRISLFDEELFTPLPEEETKNWCGGVCNGMLAFDYNGDAFPCVRYMGSSLNGKQVPLSIGNFNGLFNEEIYKNRFNLLTSITRQSQSTTECLNCPIAKGCAWCSGYNYEIFGTPNKRATFICIMHKARALANAYYYNKGHYLMGEEKRFKINLPKEEALKIISNEDWNELKKYEGAKIDE